MCWLSGSPTTINSERLFSRTSNLITKKTNRLKEDIINYTTFITENEDLILEKWLKNL